MLHHCASPNSTDGSEIAYNYWYALAANHGRCCTIVVSVSIQNQMRPNNERQPLLKVLFHLLAAATKSYEDSGVCE